MTWFPKKFALRARPKDSSGNGAQNEQESTTSDMPSLKEMREQMMLDEMMGYEIEHPEDCGCLQCQ
jgi:hypothetical protein